MQHNEGDALSAGEISTVEGLAAAISARKNNDRFMVAVAGPPGSGKTTISGLLQAELEGRYKLSAQVVPMDGFHLDDSILQQRGLLPRKGAPQTFDVDGLNNILMRLTSTPAVDVLVPVFDRERELSRASAREISESVEVILVEGNYLLLNMMPWSSLKQYFDLSVMIQCAKPVLRQRLMNRWLDLDFSQQAARTKVEENDLPNAATVISQSVKSDITFVGGTE